MKFALFTPFARASAIGRVSALIVESMHQLGHEVCIIRTEQESVLSRTPHQCEVRLIDWTDAQEVIHVVRDADAVIYQIGDNYQYHCGALHWLATFPGIVCLHDFFVAHLFNGWTQTRPRQLESVLRRWYGEGAIAEYRSCTTSVEFIEKGARSFPMTEWVCAMASAVISHSAWGMQRVARACPGPVRVVPLPYNARPIAHGPGPRHEDPDHLELLTIGHANPNKRISQIIRAIGSDPVLRRSIRYKLCGHIEPKIATELLTLAMACEVTLEIKGEVDDHALQQAIIEADVLCCLRWPSLEAASATTIEGMLYGKAVIVTDTAFYSELPDDCVAKISADREISDLTITLRRLQSDPAGRAQMAARAKAWAYQTFSASNYAEALEVFAVASRAAQPIIEMATAITEMLGKWGSSAAICQAEDIAEPLKIFETEVRQAIGMGKLSALPSNIKEILL